tara:strand:+ start:189 stop:506 length:318 start_codon:yes stop_codon:yes gene_type:complete
MSYYNTTNEKGFDLQKSHEKARNQEEIIYSFFLTYGKPLSPSQVLKKLNLECPITSVRRALTNLTNEDKIIKTDVKVVGLYGKKEHLWRLKTKQDDIDPDQYSLF